MKSYFGNNIIILLASLSIASTGCYRTGEFIYHDPLIQMHEYDFIEAIQNKEGRKMKKQVQTNIRPSDAVYTPEEPKAEVKKDTTKGYRLALEIAETGNTFGMIVVGQCYYNGTGVRKSISSMYS